MNFHSLQISKIERFTPESIAVYLNIEQPLKPNFKFSAGQYITIEHQTPTGAIRRSYSIASTPSDKELCIGLKKVKNGVFSTFANTELKEGDRLRVATPEGNFTYDPTAKRILAVGAGSGITPLLSIIKTALFGDPEVVVGLVYGNQTASTAMFIPQLEELQQQFKDRFFWVNSYSQSREGDYFGRIEKGTLLHALKNKLSTVGPIEKAYLCGPEALIQTAQETLVDAGMSSENVLFELFVASSEQKEIDTSGNAEVTVLLDGQTQKIMVDKEEFLLDSLLEQGIDAPYSCQGGSCSSCICKISEGTAEMARNQVLTDREIAQGFILSCQAKITSAHISVDFDNV